MAILVGRIVPHADLARMTTELHTTLRDMLGRYRLTAIYVFGSRATEIAARVTGAPSADHSDSDVDIGVQPTRDTRPSAEQRVRLALELEDRFAVARVDLVVISEANAPLAGNVVRITATSHVAELAKAAANAYASAYIAWRKERVQALRHHQVLGAHRG